MKTSSECYGGSGWTGKGGEGVLGQEGVVDLAGRKDRTERRTSSGWDVVGMRASPNEIRRRRKFLSGKVTRRTAYLGVGIASWTDPRGRVGY